MKAALLYSAALIGICGVVAWFLLRSVGYECPRCESLNTQPLEEGEGREVFICHDCEYEWTTE